MTKTYVIGTKLKVVQRVDSLTVADWCYHWAKNNGVPVQKLYDMPRFINSRIESMGAECLVSEVVQDIQRFFDPTPEPENYLEDRESEHEQVFDDCEEDDNEE